MKDKILQRVKEYNAVALFVKLVDELTEHYKNKLLSVSSGSYDTYTARRFDGKSKKKGQIGYKMPSQENLNSMASECSDVGLNLIRVPSETSPGVSYIVDTFLGTWIWLYVIHYNYLSYIGMQYSAPVYLFFDKL